MKVKPGVSRPEMHLYEVICYVAHTCSTAYVCTRARTHLHLLYSGSSNEDTGWGRVLARQLLRTKHYE